MGDLTAQERAALDFAARTYRHDGNREAAILVELGISPTRYAQVVNGLIDRPEAWAHAPATVKRLRRLRDQRRAARSTPSGSPSRPQAGRAVAG